MWNGICKFNAERKNIGLRDVIIAICAVKNNVTYDEFRRYILTKSNNVITSGKSKIYLSIHISILEQRLVQLNKSDSNIRSVIDRRSVTTISC